MLCKLLPLHRKFKFCVLEPSGIFFPQINVFNLWLAESKDIEPSDVEAQLYDIWPRHRKDACFVLSIMLQEAGTFKLFVICF